MLDWLKKLRSPRKEPEVEYRESDPDTPPMVPAGPPTTPYPPAVPVEKPDRQS